MIFYREEGATIEGIYGVFPVNICACCISPDYLGPISLYNFNESVCQWLNENDGRMGRGTSIKYQNVIRSEMRLARYQCN